MQYSISNLNAFIILIAIGFSFVRRFALIMLTSREVGDIDKLHKSANLPKAEMVEGPQHVSKVDTGMGPESSYNCPRDTDLYDVYCYPSWARIHSDSGPNTIASKFKEPEKNSLKSILNEQCQTLVIGMTSKKNTINMIQRNAGSPKGSNPYGDGALNSRTNIWDRLIIGQGVLSKVGQCYYSTASSASSESSANTKLNLEKLDNNKFTGLYKTIADVKTLILAYRNIKSKPGNMTEGIDSDTLDGTSNALLEDLSNKLLSGEFQFKPARRVHIPKANGNTRPLAIASPKDKIVQEAMRLVTEAIFEPTFSNLSHGFRPKRSCHSALKCISNWNGITWVIEGDIKSYFDTVDHHILAELLERRIEDQRFIDLYWKLVKAGYVEKSISVFPELGVPQGSLISPLLSNIYLHELDSFMEELIDQESSKEKSISKVNPVWNNLTYLLGKARKRYAQDQNEGDLEEMKRITKLRREVPSKVRIGNRIYYVRYADDWVVGIVGSFDLASKIKDNIMEFLTDKLKLTLSQEKTKITHMGSDRAKFLGFKFWVRRTATAKITKRYNYKAKKRIDSRINQVRVWFSAPMTEIMEKLEKQGFVKRFSNNPNTPVPNAITKFIFLDHKSIIERYNSIIRGYLNYYSPADNFYKFGSIVGYVLRHSAAKTLARKFNLRTRAGAFKKFGKNLGTTIEKNKGLKTYSLCIPQNFKNTRNFKITGGFLKDPLMALNYQIHSQSNLDETCAVCG